MLTLTGKSFWRSFVLALVVELLIACGGGSAPSISVDGPVADWPHWGGNASGTHYSPLTQITPANVAHLKPAWTYHIGMLDAPKVSSPTLEVTPIVVDNRMFICSGLGKIAALDPETGKALWAYRYTADTKGSYLLNCRGVTYHRDAPGYSGECPPAVPTGEQAAWAEQIEFFITGEEGSGRECGVGDGHRHPSIAVEPEHPAASCTG